MKKKFTFLIAALAAILLIAQPVKVMGQKTTYTYVLATSLSVGDEVVIVNTGLSKELVGVTTGNKPIGSPGDITGSAVSGINGTYILTVEAGHETGKWSFKNGTNYLAYTWTGSGNNFLTTSTTKAANSSWTVSFNDSNQAIINNCNQTTRQLQFNTDRFCCYTSSQTPIKIYKRVEAKVANPTFSPAAGNYSEAQNVEISTTTTGSNIIIKYTTDNSDPKTSGTAQVYASAIYVDKTMTIKAYGYDESVSNPLGDSDVVSAAYTIVPAHELTITSDHGSVTVTVNSEEVEPTAGVYSIPQGATVNLSASAASNWVFDNWTVNSGGVTISNNAFVMPDGDVSITANYIATTTYTFDFTSTDNFFTTASGNTHPSTGSSNNYDEFYSASNRDKFTASGTNHYFNSGYFLFGQSDATVGLPSFDGYQIIKVILHSSGSCSQSVAVSIVNGSGTTVASAQTWSVRNNDYIYTIPSEYQKSPLKVQVTNSNNAQFTNISIVCVELSSYVLTIGSPSNGTFTVKDKDNNAISNGASIKEGALVKLAATPADGYVLGAFSVTKAGSGSVEVTMDGNNGTFNMPDDAVTVNATFAAKKSLTYKANGGTGEDVVEDYANGTNVELKDGSAIFTAPSAQHYFLYWTKNADGSGTHYAAGSEYSMTENTTLYANWSNLYNVAVSSVDNVVISASYGVNNTIAEGANADVAYGTTITLNHNLGAGKTFIWDVYKTGDTETKVTVEENSFTVPAYGVTVSGEIKDVYTITFDVNGNTAVVDPVNVIEGNSIDLTANAYKPSLAGYTFKGWSETNGSATTIATPATYTPTASKTLYAVFTKVTGSDNFTLTKDSGFPAEYSSGATLTLAGHSFYVKDVGTSYNDNIQIKKNTGVIYNSSSFGKITEIKLEGTYTNTVIYYGNSSNPSSETILPGTGSNAGKYDLSEIKPEYIKITSSGGASNLTSIKITFEDSSDIIFVNSACTKASIAAGEIVNVGANGILTLTGTNAGNETNLIIEDGGQLICNNAVEATVEKSITAATDWGTESNGWYFIASPLVDNTDPDDVSGMISDDNTGEDDSQRTYDLYSLDISQDKAWQNYRNNSFDLVNGMGYLYASKEGTVLQFSGNIQPSNENVTMDGLNDGFNLVGNPYTCTAYVDQSYYTLSQTAEGITSTTVATAKSTAIAPLTGVIISGDKVIFSKNVPDGMSNPGNIQIALAQTVATRGSENMETIDNAIVSFNEGTELEKFYFGTQNANIYIPLDNEEYAIVSSNAQGEMPVNFRAYVAGEYTITVNPEEVEMGYLHLIDNIAGKDIDLLATSSYTFNAKADDYESRFRLVFSANMTNAEMGEDFAFISDGQLVIANVGEAILQVIDVTGRVVANENINGTCSKAISAKAGVYVLRLINGTDVKTQKMVIR